MYIFNMPYVSLLFSGDNPVDVTRDPTFLDPKMQLFRLEQHAEDGLIATRGVNSTVKHLRVLGKTHILWHMNKICVSMEHEAAFE